jgi:hypothetical protein
MRMSAALFCLLVPELANQSPQLTSAESHDSLTSESRVRKMKRPASRAFPADRQRLIDQP